MKTKLTTAEIIAALTAGNYTINAFEASDKAFSYVCPDKKGEFELMVFDQDKGENIEADEDDLYSVAQLTISGQVVVQFASDRDIEYYDVESEPMLEALINLGINDKLAIAADNALEKFKEELKEKFVAEQDFSIEEIRVSGTKSEWSADISINNEFLLQYDTGTDEFEIPKHMPWLSEDQQWFAFLNYDAAAVAKKAGVKKAIKEYAAKHLTDKHSKHGTDI